MPSSFDQPTCRPARLTIIAALCLPFLALGWRALAEEPAPAPATRMSTYTLRPMDVINIQVFQEAELDRQLRVSQDYTIVVPLIGVVNVKNRTVRDTELMITKFYKQDYLVNPQINITVVEYAPRSVNVLGAVNGPGSVQIPPEKEFSLLDVIARSGGFTRFANRTRVSITRTMPDGQTVNLYVNADQLVAGDTTEPAMVKDGDVVTVPERLL